ncbi:hypothetical protein PAMA_018653 [Pampus argenteus]
MQCNFNGTLLKHVLPPLLVTEFVLGVIGNGFALWIFWFHLKPWKSSTVLLFNLAVADFLLLSIALPFRAIYYLSDIKWMFGRPLCNICLFMLAMNRSGSTFFLMAIALDRYMRVVHPHHPINSLSVSKAMCGSVALWLLTISMNAHIFTLQHINTTYCESFNIETKPQSNHIWHKFEFLFSFYMPLLVILYCTVHIIGSLRGRQLAQHAKIRKALFFITAVVVLFIICFLPSNITQLLIWIKTQELAKIIPESEVCVSLENLTTVFYITISMTYLNNVLDPVVYYFSSPAVRNICRKILHLPQSENAVSSSKKDHCLICSQRGITVLKMQCNFNGTLLKHVLPPLLVTEFVLGVIGNGFALWIFWFHLKPWKSSTVLLFNLAVADFLLLSIALPFRAIYYLSDIKWMFGSPLCNICLFMLAMNRSGSTFFLMAIALDRYMRVVHPHHPINSLSVSKAMCGSVALWLLTISMNAHIFTLQHINTTYCESFNIETKPQSNHIWHKFEFLFSFYMPLLVILYCTVHIIGSLRGRQLAQHAKIRKALFFITAVVVLFIICFLPSNITQLLIWIKTQELAKILPDSEVCVSLENLTTVFYITISMTYLNNVLDPVVYYFSSPAVRNICRKILHLPQSEVSESTDKKTRETGSQSLSQL